MLTVGYLVSYDYKLLFYSLEQIYSFVDKIVIAIDVDRKTWSGNQFNIPQTFFNELKELDSQKKIEIFQDSFYVSSNTPMQNETRERNMLAKKMGSGWCIQLDADEYVYGFNKVAQYLKKMRYLLKKPNKTPVIFQGSLITLFKVLDNGILYIDNNEKFTFITNQNEFSIARRIENLDPIFTNIKVVHQSWARDNNEVLQKIKNWGHRDDFDTKAFYDFWNSLNSQNYKQFKNFHPLVPNYWNELKFSRSRSINELIAEFEQKKPQNIIGIPTHKQISLRYKAMI